MSTPTIIQVDSDNRLVVSVHRIPRSTHGWFSIDRQYLVDGEWRTDPESGITEQVKHLTSLIAALDLNSEMTDRLPKFDPVEFSLTGRSSAIDEYVRSRVERTIEQVLRASQARRANLKAR